MWLPYGPDLPREVLLGYSMILITALLSWFIVVDYRRARTTRHRTHGWILLSFLFVLGAVIVSSIVYFRRELVSYLSSARTIVSEPAVFVTLLITISYVIYAKYIRGPPSERSYQNPL